MGGGRQSLKPLIEYLVKALVDDPGQVRVEAVSDEEGTTTYEVRVAPGDLGKVIGREGRVANALRTIAKSVAMKHKLKIYLEIIDENKAAGGAEANSE